ncbi:helix-turn-helix transcriptional regulator [Rhodococcus koreensis]|uniref:helix-turn-helix transcriptional regulator n=1 Tax=Rhodococcus koreensis TaxID=99653 RepID=UPI00366CACED
MKRNDDDDDGEALSPVDAAEVLGCHPGTLGNWRTYRRGPAYHKAHAGRVFYLRADLDEWLAKQGAHARARFCG